MLIIVPSKKPHAHAGHEEGPAFGTLLRGTSDNELIKGFDTSDTLYGGGGADTLEGGLGGDTYVVTSDDLTGAGESDVFDIIRGFDPEVDQIAFESGLSADDFELRPGPVDPGDSTILVNIATGDIVFLIEGAAPNVVSPTLQSGTDDTLTLQPEDTLEDVSLMDGDDALINDGGTISGDVMMGLGDDSITSTGEIEGDIYLGAGNDIITANVSNQEVFGGVGNDTLALTGDATIWTGDGNDVILLQAPGTGIADIHDFNPLRDVIRLPNGLGPDDVMMVASGPRLNDPTLLQDLDGNTLAIIDNIAPDTIIFTEDGFSTLRQVGIVTGDNITGQPLPELLDGGDGDDTIAGGAGNDSLTGDTGNDRLAGQRGDDNLIGGSGDDALIGGSGGDRLDGGDGNDNAIYTSSDAAVTITLKDAALSQVAVAEGGHATGDTLDNIENVIASNFSDTLTGDSSNNIFRGLAGNDAISLLDGDDLAAGGAGNDSLNGGAGNDTLLGQSGNDWLIGGAGNDLLKGAAGDDILEGGAGNDTLIGGGGSDLFVIGSEGNDIIRAFEVEADTLNLSATNISDQQAFIDSAENAAGGVLVTGDNFTLLLRGLTLEELNTVSLSFDSVI